MLGSPLAHLRARADNTDPLLTTHNPGVATGVKVFLYFLCIALAAKSSSAMALAEDHRNDILSNTVAITTAAVASNYRWVR